MCDNKFISPENRNYWKEIDFYPHVLVKEMKRKTEN